MSKETKTAESGESKKKSASKKKDEHPDRIYLVSYPKVVFLYPSFLMALFAGVFLSFISDKQPNPTSTTEVAISLGFLIILGINLVVLGFDFPRTTSLTLFFCAATAVLGLALLFTFKPNLIPSLTGILTALQPVANPTFYYLFAGVLGAIYVVIMISVRFDYWEVRPNELLHHHGVLANLERIPAPQLKINKEIVDVFEFMLLRSGRLILERDNERPIVLDNVLFINKKEAELTRMLGALQVSLRID